MGSRLRLKRPTPTRSRVKTMIRNRYLSENSTNRCMPLLLFPDEFSQSDRLQLETARCDYGIARLNTIDRFDPVTVPCSELDQSFLKFRVAQAHEDDRLIVDLLDRR